MLRKRVRDLIDEVYFERFDDAERILRQHIEDATEALWRVQLAQREPVIGVSCGLFHPDGFAGTPMIRPAPVSDEE